MKFWRVALATQASVFFKMGSAEEDFLYVNAFDSVLTIIDSDILGKRFLIKIIAGWTLPGWSRLLYIQHS